MNFKSFVVVSFCILISLFSSAQGVKISEIPGNPNSSSVLDVESSTKGFLPPRMTSAQRDAIASPAAGLRIYNTTTNCENFYNGSVWQEICGQCIPGVPAMPGTISGNATVCASATAVSYSIIAVPGASSYTWTVPAGWSITSGQGTTSITVNAGSVGQNGNITVSAVNACGTSPSNTKAVSTTQPSAAFTFSPASGNINSPVAFTATQAGLAYSWGFTSATTPTATGQTANATWASSGTYTVTLQVSDANGCTASSSQTITINNCPSPFSNTQTFSFTGGVQSFVVPNSACYTVLRVELWGAQGQNNSQSIGGQGGYIKGDISVTPGETIYIYVGGQSGWNGGGAAGTGGSGAGIGGGATDIRKNGQALANRVAVAGGGGGAGRPDCSQQHGGGGGYPGGLGGMGGGIYIGDNGGTNGGNVTGGGGCNSCCSTSRGGGGGGQNGGGGAGGYGSSTGGSNGGCGGNNSDPFGGGSGTPPIGGCFGTGGSGGNYSNNGGGGGGGGWYGGGAGGGNWASGGGGGSSYIGTMTNTQTQNAIRTGNGQVIIQW
jgi:PKD repeat protein